MRTARQRIPDPKRRLINTSKSVQVLIFTPASFAESVNAEPTSNIREIDGLLLCLFLFLFLLLSLFFFVLQSNLGLQTVSSSSMISSPPVDTLPVLDADLADKRGEECVLKLVFRDGLGVKSSSLEIHARTERHFLELTSSPSPDQTPNPMPKFLFVSPSSSFLRGNHIA